MGGQLSVPQVMLSVPVRVKRSGEYSKGKAACNRFYRNFFNGIFSGISQ